MLTTGGMTGRLDRLERAGLLIRSPGPGDRRSLLVTLTDTGRALIDAAVAGGVDTQQRLIADLPTDTRRQLGDLLRDLLAAVTANAALAATGQPGPLPQPGPGSPPGPPTAAGHSGRPRA